MAAESHSSVDSIADLRTGGLWFDPWPILFPRIDDSHCDRIHCSLTTVCCFDNGYVGKQPVTWKEYCAEHWLKELEESMDKCTGCRDITEILLKTALNTIHSFVNGSITVNSFHKICFAVLSALGFCSSFSLLLYFIRGCSYECMEESSP